MLFNIWVLAHTTPLVIIQPAFCKQDQDSCFLVIYTKNARLSVHIPKSYRTIDSSESKYMPNNKERLGNVMVSPWLLHPRATALLGSVIQRGCELWGLV